MQRVAQDQPFYEYLHPFRDGNGRLGRLFANYILHLKGHPIVIIPQETKGTYIDTLLRVMRFSFANQCS